MRKTRLLVLLALGCGVVWLVLFPPRRDEDKGASRQAAAHDPLDALRLAREALVLTPLPACIERVHEALEETAQGIAFAAHQGTVSRVRFSPDGRRILTASRDHSARAWDLAGSEVALYRGHRGPVLDVCASPDGAWVLTASSDGTARLWHADGRERAVLRGHRGAVSRVWFAPGAKRLLTLGLDGEARLWDAQGRSVARLQMEDAAIVEARFLGASAEILTRSADGALQFFDAEGRSLATPRRADGGAAALRGPSLDSAGLVLSLNQGSTALLWRGAQAKPLVLQGHRAQILDAAFAPDGARFLTASLDGEARLWDRAGALICVFADQQRPVFEARYAGPGRWLTVSSEGRARLWSEQGQMLAQLEGPPFRDVGTLPSTGGLWGLPRKGGGIRLFDRDGRARGGLSAAAGDQLEALLSPDGRWLALRGADLSVSLLTPDPQTLLERAAARLDRIEAPPVSPWGDPAPCRPRPAWSGASERGAFAGTAVCATCHRKEYDLWVSSNHARTFEPALASNLPADALAGRRVLHPPGETTFSGAGESLVAETYGPDGTPCRYDLTHVVGRVRIRMYVATLEDGRMQVLPSMRATLPDTWFDYTQLLFGATDPEHAPVVAPGDDAFWTGAGRSWGARCAHCHSSGSEPRLPGADGGGPRAIQRDLGVDCEACHGPGRAHAEAWARSATDAPLLKLGTLPFPAITEACTRCHMEAELISTHYQAGEDLYEFLDPTLLLDPDRVDAAGRPLELIYHGLSFATSRCAQQGRLTCVRCHDGHGGPHPALLTKPPTNHELCAECHAELASNIEAHSFHKAGGSGSRCIACHMPLLVIERGHGLITDHTIGVPDPAARGDRVTRDACTGCHGGGLGAPEDVQRIDREGLRRAYDRWWPDAVRSRPWMDAIAAARLQEAGAWRALVDVLEDGTLPRVVRASAARLLARFAPESAEAMLRFASDDDSLVRRSALTALAAVRSEAADAALLAALEDPSRAVRRAAARAALEGWSRVRANGTLLAAILPVLREDARAVPNDEMRWFRLGAAADLAWDWPAAIEAYAAMVALHPLAHNIRQRLETLRDKPQQLRAR